MFFGCILPLEPHRRLSSYRFTDITICPLPSYTFRLPRFKQNHPPAGIVVSDFDSQPSC